MADADSSFRVLCCCRHAAGSVDPGFSFAANFLAPSPLVRMTPSTTGLSQWGGALEGTIPMPRCPIPRVLAAERGRSWGERASRPGNGGRHFLSRTVDESHDSL